MSNSGAEEYSIERLLVVIEVIETIFRVERNGVVSLKST